MARAREEKTDRLGGGRRLLGRINPRGPAARLAGRVAAVTVLCAAAVVGMSAMRDSLLASPRYARTTARIRLVGLPGWLRPDIAEGIRAAVSKRVARGSVFQGDLARNVHDAAAANPWVAKVTRVEKHRDGTVTVAAEYRKPFARVRWQGRLDGRSVSGACVVDAEAVVLPLAVHRVEPGTLILIRGAASPPPEVGARWKAADLAGGLRLWRHVGPRSYAWQCTVLDVRNHDRRLGERDSELTIYAQVRRGRSTEVRFGRLPVADGLDPVKPVEVRLGWLDGYVRKHGGQLAGVHRVIELRFDRLYVRDY